MEDVREGALVRGKKIRVVEHPTAVWRLSSNMCDSTYTRAQEKLPTSPLEEQCHCYLVSL